MLLGASIILCCVLFTRSSLAASHSHHWTYTGEHGASHWCDPDNECCGEHQSPIDIDSRGIMLETFDELELQNYNVTPKKMKLKNNGHTVVLDIDYEDDLLPTMTGGALDNVYEFKSLHFHWGLQNEAGSEHTVDSKYSPAEMHLVHFNKKYDDIGTALSNSDGLAVLGAFLEISDKDNMAFQEIVKALSNVRYSGDSQDLAGNFPLEDLLPSDHTSFYRYKGSLTTPPCNEVVTWTLLTTPVPISEKQLEKFRSLRADGKSDDGHEVESLTDNYRPTQQLHGRHVYKRVAKRDMLDNNVLPSISGENGATRASQTGLVLTVTCLMMITAFNALLRR